jgi:hypothetical protein
MIEKEKREHFFFSGYTEGATENKWSGHKKRKRSSELLIRTNWACLVYDPNLESFGKESVPA